MRAVLIPACVAVFFLLFFFLVPIVQMNVMPCYITGKSYSSLSYHMFNIGLAYITNPNGAVFFGPIPQNLIYCW